MDFGVYVDGGKIKNVYGHPAIKAAADAVAATYDMQSYQS